MPAKEEGNVLELKKQESRNAFEIQTQNTEWGRVMKKKKKMLKTKRSATQKLAEKKESTEKIYEKQKPRGAVGTRRGRDKKRRKSSKRET